MIRKTLSLALLTLLCLALFSEIIPLIQPISIVYATSSEATTFTWQIKGHDVYGTGQDWDVLKLWESALGINSSSATKAEYFVFESINRTWLDGKYFRWCWGGYYNSSGLNNEETYFVQVYDGSYTSTNTTEFPVGAPLLEKGAGKLQEYAQNCTPGTLAPEIHELLLDTSSGTEDNVTIFFRLLDPWTNDKLSMVLFETQVNTGSDGVGVLKGGRFVGNIEAWGIVTGGVAQAIISGTALVTNWTETIDMTYLGYSLGKVSLSTLQTEIDKLSNSSWKDILYWYAVTKKFGLENQTTIERALTNAVILANGLPNSTHIYDTSAFLVYDRYLLLGYNWSDEYSFETAKWNKTTAASNFAIAVEAYGQPPLWVYNNNTAYAYLGDPRYYDEIAETIDVFRVFAEIGVSDALTGAKKWWDWMNINRWNSTGEFYIYKGSEPDAFECEAGGMEQIIWRLYDSDGTIGNVSRMMQDAQTRFLNNSWDSYQWTLQSQPSFYVVNHEHSGTLDQRLSNTIMAWSALLGVYRNLSTSYQQTIQEMLNGSAYDASAPIPAWALLGSRSANLWLYNKFKWTGSDSVSNGATAAAAAFMLNLAVVPETGIIAIPLEEFTYEYKYAMIDRDLFHINLTTYTVRFPVASAGTFTFMFGGIPFQYELPQSGLWDLTFSSDWNNITTSTRLSALPTNRFYLTRVIYPYEDAYCVLISPTNTTYILSTIPVEIFASGGTIDTIWWNCTSTNSTIVYGNTTYTVETSMTLGNGSYVVHAMANNTEGSEHETSVMFTVLILPHLGLPIETTTFYISPIYLFFGKVGDILACFGVIALIFSNVKTLKEALKGFVFTMLIMIIFFVVWFVMTALEVYS